MKIIIILVILLISVPCFASTVADYPTLDFSLSQKTLNSSIAPVQSNGLNIGVEFPIINTSSSIYFDFLVGATNGINENGAKIGYKLELR